MIEARYKGQNHEVQVRLADDDVQLDDFVAAFADAHRREYGYDIPGRAIEVVNCRLKAIGLIERPAPHFIGATGAPQPKTTRQVHFDAGWIETPVFDRADLAVGTRLSGPAVIDEMSATTLVPPGCHLSVDRSGNLLLEIARHDRSHRHGGVQQPAAVDHRGHGQHADPLLLLHQHQGAQGLLGRAVRRRRPADRAGLAHPAASRLAARQRAGGAGALPT